MEMMHEREMRVPIRYGFLQFRPDYTSGEVYNWGILFVIPEYDVETQTVDTERHHILIVYDKDASRLRLALPSYPEEAQNSAIKAIRKVLKPPPRPTTVEETLQRIIDALPLGFEYREGGIDYIEPQYIEPHIQTMYARYVMRFPDTTEYPHSLIR